MVAKCRTRPWSLELARRFSRYKSYNHLQWIENQSILIGYNGMAQCVLIIFGRVPDIEEAASVSRGTDRTPEGEPCEQLDKILRLR